MGRRPVFRAELRVSVGRYGRLWEVDVVLAIPNVEAGNVFTGDGISEHPERAVARAVWRAELAAGPLLANLHLVLPFIEDSRG